MCGTVGCCRSDGITRWTYRNLPDVSEPHFNQTISPTDHVHSFGALGQVRHKPIAICAPGEQLLRVQALLDPAPDVPVDILRSRRQIDLRERQVRRQERILLREAGRAGRDKYPDIRRGQGAKQRDEVRSVLVPVEAMQDQKDAVEQFRRVDERTGELGDAGRRLLRYEPVVQDARDADEVAGLTGELQCQAAEDVGRVLVAGRHMGEEEEGHGVFGQLWCRLDVLNDLRAGVRETDMSVGVSGIERGCYLIWVFPAPPVGHQISTSDQSNS